MPGPLQALKSLTQACSQSHLIAPVCCPAGPEVPCSQFVFCLFQPSAGTVLIGPLQGSAHRQIAVPCSTPGVFHLPLAHELLSGHLQSLEELNGNCVN